MSRPEKPLPDSAGKELRALAQHLRGLRSAAGLGYRELAAHPHASGYSAATFRRAANGEQVPAQEVTAAFAKACGGNPAKALRLRLNAARGAAWEAARKAWVRSMQDAIATGRPSIAPPPPHLAPSDVRSLPELLIAMRYIHLQAGAPSSRELERAAPPGHLPHTTLDRLLDSRAKPQLPSPELLDAFLTGCGVPAPRRDAWISAYMRLLDDDPTLRVRAQARRLRGVPLSHHVPPEELEREEQRREMDRWRFQLLRRDGWETTLRSAYLPRIPDDEYDPWPRPYDPFKVAEIALDY
ncbi:helix-turn-helix domain-containing protein [Kitasatospora indigofera]|uniref:helix-turn-helix domain-containing protein n=1 Tax=Kitasatospora indigofera TaxID=67307 RepID=UPI0033A84F77